jgi:hypothetical protein
MKILHVAVFTPKSTNVWQAQGFEDLGHKVVRYDYRVRARALSTKKRDDELIKLCCTSKPDFVLFAKCNDMHYRVVEECRKVTTTIMWMPDGGPNINDEFEAKLGHCDFVFCSAQYVADLAKGYCPNSYRVQGGYDSKVHYPIDVPKKRDAVFIGDLKGKVHDYRIKYKKEVNFEVVTGVYNKNHSRVVSESRINLGFSLGRSTSNRIYKLMAARGFVLTMPWEGMEKDFGIGIHLDIFSTPEQLQHKIDFYLADPWLREKIANQGYEKVKEYDNINYAKRILAVI